MKTVIPFELTNEQRKYLGLQPVEDSWELVCFDGKYYYYDGDIIRKQISVDDEGSYKEEELYERTAENRTVLLPKTNRGKPKKMNHTATMSFRPIGGYFSFSRGGVYISNDTTQITLFHQHDLIELSLQQWLDKWISETTEADLQEIERYKNATRKRVKYREGDFFAFRIGRRKWGFGRIVLNIVERRKWPSFKAKKNYGLCLMTTPLYIMVYQKIADTPCIDIEELASCGTLPVQPIADNNIYYGEYPIIGHKPVVDEEWEPVISYGRSIRQDDRDTVYLQYGLIFKETTIDKFDKYLVGDDGQVNPFRLVEAIGWGIDNYHIIEELIAESETEAARRVLRKTDLRAEVNRSIKQEIFKLFGLDADKSYAENLKAERLLEGGASQ